VKSDAQILRELRVATLSTRDRVAALVRALHVGREDQAEVDLCWTAINDLVEEPQPRWAKILRLIHSARCRGIAIDRHSLARACGCATTATLTTVWPAIAEALEERKAPARTMLVPAPVTAWPARGGVS
jgi:hypothetical protein